MQVRRCPPSCFRIPEPRAVSCWRLPTNPLTLCDLTPCLYTWWGPFGPCDSL